MGVRHLRASRGQRGRQSSHNTLSFLGVLGANKTCSLLVLYHCDRFRVSLFCTLYLRRLTVILSIGVAADKVSIVTMFLFLIMRL